MTTILVFLLVVLLGTSCGDGTGISDPLSRPSMALALSDGTPLEIRGLDFARGFDFSMPEGDDFTAGRQSLLAVNPNVAFSGVSQLSDAGLVGADIFVVASARSNTSLITPLTPAEQDVLHHFVSGGGCAVVFADNIGLEAANESVIDPFGLDAAGILVGPQDITVSDPNASPVTDGPFGVVATIRTNVPGGFDQLGPYAVGLASSALGPVLAVIEPGAITPGSGPVILYADVNGFADEGFNSAGRFSQNEVLWLNTFDYCLSTADPDERIESIKSGIDELVSGGTLGEGEGGSLTMKMSVTQKKISQGNVQAAINALNAFIKQVGALVNSGRLTEDEGQTLIDAAQSVIDQLVSG